MDFIENPSHLFECFTGPGDPNLSYSHPKYPLVVYEGGYMESSLDGITLSTHPINPATFLTVSTHVTHEFIVKYPDLNLSYRSAMNCAQLRLRGNSGLAYEAYHNIMLGGNQKVLHLNHNPWDKRKCNLFLPKDLSKKELEHYKQGAVDFLDKTIKEIDNRAKAARAKGLDVDGYITQIVHQKWFKIWKKREFYI